MSLPNYKFRQCLYPVSVAADPDRKRPTSGASRAAAAAAELLRSNHYHYYLSAPMTVISPPGRCRCCGGGMRMRALHAGRGPPATPRLATPRHATPRHATPHTSHPQPTLPPSSAFSLHFETLQRDCSCRWSGSPSVCRSALTRGEVPVKNIPIHYLPRRAVASRGVRIWK